MRYSRKARSARATALVFGEGESDQAFLRHLVFVYCCHGHLSRPKITVKKGRGGSADGIVDDASRVQGHYNRKLVKLDKDRRQSEIDTAIRLAEKNSITIIFSQPCLEALLLEILEPGKSFRDQSSEHCKKVFNDKYIPNSKRSNPKNYRTLFTKRKLQAARKKIPELNKLVTYMEVSR